MPTPQILADIARLLIQLLPAMALVCLFLAGIALRLEGGSTFLIGGGFTKWIFWGIIMLTLPGLLLWFSFFGLPVPSTAGTIGTGWLAGIQNGVATFVNFENRYRDTLSVPNRGVSAWTTVDLQLSYETTGDALGWLGHAQFVLNTQNLFDVDPPFLNNNAAGVGYDQENADLYGRMVSFEVRKRW